MNQEAYRRRVERQDAVRLAVERVGMAQGEFGIGPAIATGPLQRAMLGAHLENDSLIMEQDVRRDNLAESLTIKLCDAIDWRGVGDPKALVAALAEAALAAASVIYPELGAEGE